MNNQLTVGTLVEIIDNTSHHLLKIGDKYHIKNVNNIGYKLDSKPVQWLSEDEIKRVHLTCDECTATDCVFAGDSYNTDNDCLDK